MIPSNILVISPHTDDEILGLGGTLLKRKINGDRIRLAVMSCSDRYLHHLGRVITHDEQLNEFRKSSLHLSTEDPINFDTDGKRLEEIPKYKIVSWLDETIRSLRPDTIYIPEPSYHQEHQDVYNACISALRPTERTSVNEIIAYEITTSTWSDPDKKFLPNLYEDISGTIDEKIRIFKENYPLQYTQDQREKLGEAGITNHARYRGFECGLDFAEAFRTIRQLKR